MEDKQLNSAESIELIQRMLATTNEKYRRGSGTMFLLFGYISLVVGVVTTLAVQFSGNNLFSFLWWLIPVVGFPVSYYINRKHPKQVNTYVDNFLNVVWGVLGTFLVLFPLAGMLSVLIGFMLIPFESLMISIGILITGITVRLKPIILSGVIATVLSFLMFFISSGYEYVFMAMFILGMIVPGHLLNNTAKSCSKS